MCWMGRYERGAPAPAPVVPSRWVTTGYVFDGVMLEAFYSGVVESPPGPPRSGSPGGAAAPRRTAASAAV